MKRKWFFIETAGLFAADQLLKTYAEQNLDKKEERKLAGPAVLRRVHNKGLCMEFLSENQTAVRYLSLAAAGIVTICQAVISFRRKGFWKKQGLALMSAGAWSNTFDRFARGYVIDYVGFDVKDPKAAKITYNLGDFFIAAGAAILSLCALFSPSKKKKEEVERIEDPEQIAEE